MLVQNLVPVVAVLADEVGDFPEGLLHDCMFEWHGGVRDGIGCEEMCSG